MADPRDRTPRKEAKKAALRALGFPEASMPAVRSARDADRILHNIRTPEEMRRFIGSGGTPIQPGGATVGGTPPSKPKSDDLPYTGPPIKVTDLGPDPLDGHGAPGGGLGEARGSEPSKADKEPSSRANRDKDAPAPAAEPLPQRHTHFLQLARRYIIPATNKTGGLRLCFDGEADGLLDVATKIHCIVVVDVD